MPLKMRLTTRTSTCVPPLIVGATWSGVATVAGLTTIGRDGMLGCTTFSGDAKKVLCVSETTEETLPLFTVKSVVSNDDGETWGERNQVYIPIGSSNNGNIDRRFYCGLALTITSTTRSPQAMMTSTGTLVVSFMTDKDTLLHEWYSRLSVVVPYKSQRRCRVTGTNFKIITSASADPPSWGQTTAVSGVQSNWPGLLTNGDGAIFGCADNWVVCHSILFN